MNIIETERLAISHLSLNDSEFIFRLTNDPDWLKYIGDRGIKNHDDAGKYISDKIISSYNNHGFGLYLVKEKNSDSRIGICGLLKRDYLESVDIGFAFLPEFRGKGYAFESAAAVIEYGKDNFGLKKILAITQSNNNESIKLLNKLGLSFREKIKLPDEKEKLELFSIEL
ncbi:MAG: GNAT family N-acetyltransferase [Ignavibacteriae bacterium HGW-Ignavibacteriae-3]|nr:MAG: GNAT family N-acetyltransferase [Ignavibacteriae bacterium HGW-Ignavibacteriae-3]